MSRNPYYPKMQEMGSWLEEFLAQRLENPKIKELFKKAIKLLDLHYAINHDHPTFKKIEELCQRGEHWEKGTEGILGGAGLRGIRESINILSNLFKHIHENEYPWHVALYNLFERDTDKESLGLLTKEYLDIKLQIEAIWGSKTVKEKEKKNVVWNVSSIRT